MTPATDAHRSASTVARRDMSRFAGNFAFNLGSLAARLALGVALTAVMTRQLGRDGYGAYNLALVALFALGVITHWPMSALPRFGRREWESEAGVSKSFSASLALVGIGLLLGDAAAIWFREPVSRFIGCSPRTFLLFVVVQNFWTLLGLSREIHRAVGSMRLYAVFAPLNTGLALLALLALSPVADIGLAEVAAAQAFASAACVAFSLGWARVKYGLRFRLETSRLREAFFYAIPLIFSMATGVINHSVDRAILRFVLEQPGEVGLYGLAAAISGNIDMLPSMFATLLFPILVSLRFTGGKGDGEESGDSEARIGYYVRRLSAHFLLPYLLVILALAFFGREIIFLISGREYAGSYGPLAWLLMAMFLTGLRQLMAPIFSAYDLLKYVMLISLGSLILNTMFDFILVGPYGRTGVAAATFFADIFSAGASVWLVWRRFHVREARHLFFVAALLAGVGIAAAVEGLPARIGLGAIFLFSFVIAFRSLGLIRRDDSMLAQRFGAPAPFARLFALWVTLWSKGRTNGVSAAIRRDRA